MFSTKQNRKSRGYDVIGRRHNDTMDTVRDDLIRPKKLFNPVLESSSRRGLHRELLVSLKTVCRGLLPEKKPELKRVLDQRRLEQHREREQASHPPSDLEQELHKRRQRLLAVQDLQNMPEFVRVRTTNTTKPIFSKNCFLFYQRESLSSA
uniref:Si:ch211-160o17.6 n=1 Tax=Sinocyclocheilus rhinocerous TaxID=307959 RepID=A0A673K5T0_9TELE